MKVSGVPPYLKGLMMDPILEMIEKLRNPGDDGLPDTIYDDLTTTYSDVSGGWSAKSDELSQALQAKDNEISRLKAINFDLLMSSPRDESTDTDTDTADDVPGGIDTLFGKDDD